MPPLSAQSDRRDLLDRRHPEHCEFELRWIWEQDSLEGGNRYRTAEYGRDDRGLPQQNMIRHKRDYAIKQPQREGADSAASSSDSDFELRVARTPPPTFVDEATGIHLSKVLKSEPEREGPPQLEIWWQDVDGRGTAIKEWLEEHAPLYLVNAQIDICVDHPPAPDGEIINTHADEIRLGLTKAVMRVVLPQNMLWWRLDAQGRYVECLVREPQDDGCNHYRHWTPTDWTLYAEEDTSVEVVEQGNHPYGRPPIERVLFRKRTRCTNVGVNRYEPVCELARAYYNLDGELVLSDSLQAHATLQMPADLMADGEIQVGPSNVLPKIKVQNSDGSVDYIGSDFVEPPKGPADSIRTNMQRIRDEIDRLMCLTKPAGAQGTSGQTVSQSGISKVMDQSTGNDLLTNLASALARLEWTAASLALLVLGNGQVEDADLKAIRISYPKTFELADAATLTTATEGLQGILAAAGSVPKTETRLATRLVGLLLPGLDPEVRDEIEDEIEDYIESKATQQTQQAEANAVDPQANTNQEEPVDPMADAETEDPEDSEDL